jgi:hypothetical protein
LPFERILVNRFSRIAAIALGAALVVAPTLPAQATVTSALDCKFGPAQVFDVQWYIESGVLHISGVTRPYGTEVNGGGQLAAQDWVDGYYVKFVESTSNPGTLGLERFDSTDTSLGLLDNTGVFTALGDDFIFYNGGGSWGTVITTGEGYAYGSSADLTITNDAPTADDVRNYTNCDTTVLAAGQVRGGGSSGGGSSSSADLALNLKVKVGEVIAGKDVDYSGSGLMADSDYTLELHSQVIILGTGVTDGSGNFTSTVQLPAGIKPGPHEIVLRGTDPDGNEVTRTAWIYVSDTGALVAKSYKKAITEADVLAMTGVDAGQLTAAAAIALAAIGGGVALGIRRRRSANR